MKRGRRLLKTTIEVALHLAERLTGFHTAPGGYLPHRLQMLTGRYEAEETKLMRKFLKPGQTIVDVGANVGYLTRIFARATGTLGRVLAFEPNPLIFPLLAGNVAKLKQVDVFNRGLSSEAGSFPLFLAGRNHSVASFAKDYPAKHLTFHGNAEVESVQAKVTTGDESLIREEIEHVDLIKIDVEGWEIDVLNGLERTISSSRNMMIFCEYNPSAQECAGRTRNELPVWLLDRQFILSYPNHGKLCALSRDSLPQLAEALGPRGYTTIFAKRA